MLVTASIALLGVSLGGASAPLEPLPVELISTLELVSDAFRSATEPSWRCRQDVHPLDVSHGAILEPTVGSHSVELLPTECRVLAATFEPDGSVLELRRTKHVARTDDADKVPAPGVTHVPDRSIASPNGLRVPTRTVMLPCRPFNRSEPYPGGNTGLEPMFFESVAEYLTGCAGEVEAVGGYVVSIAGVRPGGHDVHTPWEPGSTALAFHLLERPSSSFSECIDRPLSCCQTARRGFNARAGAVLTGSYDVSSEDQSRPISDSGDQSALHVEEPEVHGMSGRTVVLEEDCIIDPTSITSAFREDFSEPKECADNITRPSGFVVVTKQEFLAGFSSLGAANGGDFDYPDHVGVDCFPSVELPERLVAMPMRAAGDLDGYRSVDGAGPISSLGRWR